MQYIRLGSSGLQVSRLCLGCMTFGEPLRGPHEWTLNEEKSRPIIRKALESGINFFDTANMYSAGSSEEIVGKLLKEMVPRDEVVVATKVHMRMRPGPNGGGLSRKAIMHEIDQSLTRLGMDYVDLYQIHRLDREVPMEEILEALHDLVKAGKVRYIGACSLYAWEFATMLHLADKHGWTRFVSMQNYVNLLYREEEREMLPLCEAEGIGVLPWSPLARGKLTRDWDETTFRSETDAVSKTLYEKTADPDRQVAAAVATVAARRGVPRAQIALAWLLNKSVITSPIIGASKTEHLDDAVAALEIRLSDDEISELEEAYVPHPVTAI
ncbi:aldo/keto reductase [Sphingobium nicotianae]|uniref:Aldo/keto reductase n=1 Tax=Sphingobium nicotianae TaxID=2782607 RepID=A0A9X1DAS3_9SPHN|nr:aldo/keto reductase [Sphingobium nicotianae]MBT2186548.1 aldo/keto reductase [Sphingobium nicotianae]